MATAIVPVVASAIEAFLEPLCSNLASSRTQGSLEWQNLELDAYALSRGAWLGTQLPFRLLVGSIGLLRVSFPWSAFIAMPANSVCLSLRDVCVVLEPMTNWDPVALRENEVAIREAALEALNQRLLDQVDSTPEDEKTGSSFSWRELRSSLTKSILSQMFSSLRVDISNVHVRIEVPSEVCRQPFAAGISIPFASLQSPRVATGSAAAKEFQCFVGAYVENSRGAMSREDHQDYLREKGTKLMEEYHDGSRQSTSGNINLLKPVLVKGMLFSPCHKTGAEIGFYCEVPEVGVHLRPCNFGQAACIVRFVESFLAFKKAHTFYRPLLDATLPPPRTRPSLAPRLWWRWAVDAIHRVRRAEDLQLNWFSSPVVRLLRKHSE